MVKVEKLTQRLNALDQAIQVREAIKAAHAPFVMFQPWDMLNDQYNVSFYPEGKYQKPIKHEQISYADAAKILKRYPMDLWCQLSMGECIEWLFVFHLHDDGSGYTEEQKDRLTGEYLRKHPKLELLLSTDDGRQMIETLAKLPQTATIRLGELQNALLNC